VSPTEFFWGWALNSARRRLTGFDLAGYYRHTFGESPSETLRTTSTG